MKYLIDTDWVIHYLNGQRDIVRCLDELWSKGLGLSIISLAELYEGVYYSRDVAQSEHAIGDFLRTVSLLSLDEEICRLFGRERGRLRAAKKAIGDFDLLIGVTAIRHGLVLLTNNRRHFEIIDGLQMRSQ